MSISLFRISIITAVVFINSIASAEESEIKKMFNEAVAARKDHKLEKAISLLTDLLKKDPKHIDALYYRGRMNFRLGNIEQSIKDLEQVAKLNPARDKQLWELGISYYYAKQYDKGAKQFALYQTYYDNDVENSVWRYACMAKSDSVEKARKNLLKIKQDRRVPFMEIYAMFQGKLKPEDVLKVANQGKPSKEQLNSRLFYTHLYIGLFYEAAGKNELAKKHLIIADSKNRKDDYMWGVAHVHVERLKKQKKSK